MNSGRNLLIDGRLLREDREDRLLSREALLARVFELDGVRVSDSTLRRAEEGDVSRPNLKWLAHALGFAPERYLAVKSAWAGGHANFDLTGRWRVFYFENDIDAPAYLSEERLHIKQEGTRISGVYEPLASAHPGGYEGTDSFLMEGLIIEAVVMGRYFRDAVSHPRGFGVFQLLMMRSGSWAEGVCSFYGDDSKIMASLNIWLREDSAEYSTMERQARGVLRDNVTLLGFPLSV